MKQNDIAQILVVGVFALILAMVLSNVVFSPSSKKTQKKDIISAINSDFKEPDKRFFNDKSVNPTQTIRIGENANNQPFN